MSLDSVIQKICYNLVDATALTAASLPVYATIEMLVGMPIETSLETRAAFAVATYLGGGGIVGYFRDVSQKLFHVSDHTRESVQHSHDRAYNAVCCFFSELIFSGAASWFSQAHLTPQQLLLVAALAGMIGYGIGGWEFYAMDVFRDVFGLKITKRLPQSIREASSAAKKRIGVEVMCLSLAITGLVYQYTPNIHK